MKEIMETREVTQQNCCRVETGPPQHGPTDVSPGHPG